MFLHIFSYQYIANQFNDLVIRFCKEILESSKNNSRKTHEKIHGKNTQKKKQK